VAYLKYQIALAITAMGPMTSTASTASQRAFFPAEAPAGPR
jgi:hypothetical protein